MTLWDQSLPNIRAISPYLPGKPITQLSRELGIPTERIIKLASNENPLGMSPKARIAVEKAIASLERYPDDYELKSALADRTGLGMERFVLGKLRSAWIGVRSFVVFHALRRFPIWIQRLTAPPPRVVSMGDEPS